MIASLASSSCLRRFSFRNLSINIAVGLEYKVLFTDYNKRPSGPDTRHRY